MPSPSPETELNLKTLIWDSAIMAAVYREFHIPSSRVDSQYVLAFVIGGDMPKSNEVSSLASPFLRVESKLRTCYGFVSMYSRVFLEPLTP